jgi:hypothetical protein
MWNPIGYDPSNLAGEYSVVRNVGTAPVSLGGWWLRSSDSRRFIFPAGTSLAPGDSVTVHTGPSSGFSFGFEQPMFENPGDSHHLGDGVYLFDPGGDVRAALSYPCVVACTDELQGTLAFSVHERDPESFTVHNVSGAPADLYGYAIALPGSWFAFKAGTVLPPGGTLRVTPSDFGVHEYILPDPGGSVRLADFADVTLACAAWGSGRC